MKVKAQQNLLHNRFSYFAKGSYPGDIINKAKRNANATGTLVNKSKYTVRGAIAGAIVGFIGFAAFHKNKYAGVVIGAISGAFIGNVYAKIDEKLKVLNDIKTTDEK